ncbi:hypothetical protein F5Y13DRAFT_91876 [Hypoxylon sp. FL1857]|nr:hypothetical protein F5Y13DRAFT_91876 [Hypoxylon sp. FL1857]
MSQSNHHVFSGGPASEYKLPSWVDKAVLTWKRNGVPSRKPSKGGSSGNNRQTSSSRGPTTVLSNGVKLVSPRKSVNKTPSWFGRHFDLADTTRGNPAGTPADDFLGSTRQAYPRLASELFAQRNINQPSFDTSVGETAFTSVDQAGPKRRYKCFPPLVGRTSNRIASGGSSQAESSRGNTLQPRRTDEAYPYITHPARSIQPAVVVPRASDSDPRCPLCKLYPELHGVRYMCAFHMYHFAGARTLDDFDVVSGLRRNPNASGFEADSVEDMGRMLDKCRNLLVGSMPELEPEPDTSLRMWEESWPLRTEAQEVGQEWEGARRADGLFAPLDGDDVFTSSGGAEIRGPFTDRLRRAAKE